MAGETSVALKIERVPWSVELEHRLRPAFSFDEDLHAIRHEVLSGTSAAFDAGSAVGVVRIEGKEMVGVAIAGRDYIRVLSQVIDEAFEAGCTSFRIHTKSRAVLRMLRRFNPQPVESVVRIFNNGRT